MSVMVDEDFSWSFGSGSENEDGDAEKEKVADCYSASPSGTRATRARSARKKTRSLKVRESQETITSQLESSVIVKCSQTGEQLCVKVQDLTKEGALPLLNEGLCEGSSLLLERDHKVFPVQFIKFKESAPLRRKDKTTRKEKTSRSDKKGKTPKNSRKPPQKRQLPSDTELPSNTDPVQVLKKAKDSAHKKTKPANPLPPQHINEVGDMRSNIVPSTSSEHTKGSASKEARILVPLSPQHSWVRDRSSKTVPQTSIEDNEDATKNDLGTLLQDGKKQAVYTSTGRTTLDNSDKDLIIMMTQKFGKMEEAMKWMVKEMKTLKSANTSVAVKEELIESHSGKKINVNRIPAKDEYQYGLRLLDVLFSKEELVGCLMVKSKRSEKPGLDKRRIDLLCSLIDKRYGTKWDMSVLVGKINQKCRDAENYFSSSSSESDDNDKS